MKQQIHSPVSVPALWKLARSGELRAAAELARETLGGLPTERARRRRVELHLIGAFCSMRQGHHSEALRELEIAAHVASTKPSDGSAMGLRVDSWRAELAYFQGRYSEAAEAIDRLIPLLERRRDWAYVAFALRIKIAIYLARVDYESALAIADLAILVAERSGDDYVIVQILNVLGAVYFDQATSKLNQPHAHAHLSSLDPGDAGLVEADARRALALFQRARAVAERSGNEFAAWYVAGNIERLEILLGRAERAIRPMRKRLAIMQARGATYDEIVVRSNLAWGLRALGRYKEALHELDAAFTLARASGTANVLLEFLEYDRSIVLDALGESTAARSSYRRYLQLAGGRDPNAPAIPSVGHSSPKQPLEPYFLKRADRFIQDHIGAAFTVSDLATHCGVSERTLEKAFAAFRGLSPVSHVRNVRLDHARQAMAEEDAKVAVIAARYGFQSSTTFALEYRKRFGVSPSRSRKATNSNPNSDPLLR